MDRKLCRNCKFIMQGMHSMVCGHKEANLKGNGEYIYPPMDWECDIPDYYETAEILDWEITKAECAKTQGWELITSEDGITKYERK